ncbi:MAG: carbamoyl-phosphate synthase small subunit [Planctomycetota bacterium]|nr:MAG: carbamoyl-phosphate synthase small subunit [Planctomycetota bacterium]
MICKLALEDGAIFTGQALGAEGTRSGEVVFNTAMTGYQEIFTDPSYCGQIVTMTFPMIGNYGVNAEDFESSAPHLAGFVVKQTPPRPSNFRATADIRDFLRRHDIVALSGIDTRALTRRIRVHGALRGVISTEVLDELELVRMASAVEVMSGANLVQRVAPAVARDWSEPLWTPAPLDGDPRRAEDAAEVHIVAIDCGIKQNILRHLVAGGCRVTVVPADTPPDAIRELHPSAVLVGNGPGDPAAVTETVATLAALIGESPILGICLGHQLLALALGASTYKLRFGHHGANVPVLNHPAGRVEITSQNHGFAVDIESLERVGGQVTHINLNDGSLEGFVHEDRRIVAVQFHPEASPGPHDAGYLFERFVDRVRSGEPICAEMLAQ